MSKPAAGEEFEVRIVDAPIPGDPGPLDVDAACGAVASFRGVVRGRSDGRDVTAVEYDCYREMAEREMRGVLASAAARYGLSAGRIVHRTGIVAAGETSVFVLVVAAHRSAAFDAVRDVVDGIKKRAPIWKKEHYADGTSRWL